MMPLSLRLQTNRGACLLHTAGTAKSDSLLQKVQYSLQIRLTGTKQEGKRKSKEVRRCVIDRVHDKEKEKDGDKIL